MQKASVVLIWFAECLGWPSPVDIRLSKVRQTGAPLSTVHEKETNLIYLPQNLVQQKGPGTL